MSNNIIDINSVISPDSDMFAESSYLVSQGIRSALHRLGSMIFRFFSSLSKSASRLLLGFHWTVDSEVVYQPIQRCAKGPGRRGLLKIIIPPSAPFVQKELCRVVVRGQRQDDLKERKRLWEKAVSGAVRVKLPSTPATGIAAPLPSLDSIVNIDIPGHTERTVVVCCGPTDPNTVDTPHVTDGRKKLKGPGKSGLLRIKVTPPRADVGEQWLRDWVSNDTKCEEVHDSDEMIFDQDMLEESFSELPQLLTDGDLKEFIRKTEQLLIQGRLALERDQSLQEVGSPELCLANPEPTSIFMPHPQTAEYAGFLCESPGQIEAETDVWLEIFSAMEEGKITATESQIWV